MILCKLASLTELTRHQNRNWKQLFSVLAQTMASILVHQDILKPGMSNENYNTHQQTTIGSILEQESKSNFLKTRNRLNITKKETMKTRPPG